MLYIAHSELKLWTVGMCVFVCVLWENNLSVEQAGWLVSRGYRMGGWGIHTHTHTANRNTHTDTQKHTHRTPPPAGQGPLSALQEQVQAWMERLLRYRCFRCS